MRYVMLGLLIGMALSYLIETYIPSIKGLASLVVLCAITLGMFTEDHFAKKKQKKANRLCP